MRTAVYTIGGVRILMASITLYFAYSRITELKVFEFPLLFPIIICIYTVMVCVTSLGFVYKNILRGSLISEMLLITTLLVCSPYTTSTFLVAFLFVTVMSVALIVGMIQKRKKS